MDNCRDLQGNDFYIFQSTFCLLLFLFVYNWNAAFVKIDTSPLYIPHITKITVITSFIGYLFFRGFIRPLKVNENFYYLFPINWIFLGLLGFMIDLVKAPGMLYGSLLYLFKKINLLFFK